ncbi:hypothetical protein V6N12_054461 [Hibiscus sabdariffa]|uniref:Uncharacterized protein n=1 Tax=Hibiscus sabdariffa TaxID=183260 RepID=A0ABR2D0H7_9ROSI
MIAVGLILVWFWDSDSDCTPWVLVAGARRSEARRVPIAQAKAKALASCARLATPSVVHLASAGEGFYDTASWRLAPRARQMCAF